MNFHILSLKTRQNGNLCSHITHYNFCMEIVLWKNLEIKNINKDIVDWVENVAEENNCRVERKEWKSKYNSYVVYDYEPFCSEGFEINLLLSSFDISYLNFIKYLYNEKLSTIEYLDNCIKIPAIKNYIV